MQEEELIAVRIKDGIFVGNVAAAGDHEFLGMNKITHVINCAGGEVADYFMNDPDLKYLSFPWKDAAGSVCTTVLFDPADENIKRAVQFIDGCIAAGECVLVHSYYGISRSPALVAAYFIIKYGWKLESALQFLEMAHPDVSIKPHFLRQLRTFAKNHPVDHDIFDRNVDDSEFALDNEQWMLRNTLLNGLVFEDQQSNELYHLCSERIDIGTKLIGTDARRKKKRISFIDTHQGTDTQPTSAITPVVNVKPVHHIDPTANDDVAHFVGSQGSVALRCGRRSPSIMSRSTSPCTRRLESDPRSGSKGRQVIPLQKRTSPPPSEAPAPGSPNRSTNRTTALRANVSRSIKTQAGLTSSAADDTKSQPASPLSSKPSASAVSSPKRDYKRLAPPSASTQPRSPFTSLSSNRKYRNGSPLPLPKESAGQPAHGPNRPASTRTRITSSPSSRIAPSTVLNSPRRTPSTSSVDRASGLSSRPISTARAATESGTVSRASMLNYRGIAPQRSAPTRPSWNSSRSLEAGHTPVARQLSPSVRVSAPRTSSVKSRSASASSKPSATGPSTISVRRSSLDSSLSESAAAGVRGQRRSSLTSLGDSVSDSRTGHEAGPNRYTATQSSGTGGVVSRRLPSAISSARR